MTSYWGVRIHQPQYFVQGYRVCHLMMIYNKNTHTCQRSTIKIDIRAYPRFTKRNWQKKSANRFLQRYISGNPDIFFSLGISLNTWPLAIFQCRQSGTKFRLQ